MDQQVSTPVPVPNPAAPRIQTQRPWAGDPVQAFLATRSSISTCPCPYPTLLCRFASTCSTTSVNLRNVCATFTRTLEHTQPPPVQARRHSSSPLTRSLLPRPSPKRSKECQMVTSRHSMRSWKRSKTIFASLHLSCHLLHHRSPSRPTRSLQQQVPLLQQGLSHWLKTGNVLRHPCHSLCP